MKISSHLNFIRKLANAIFIFAYLAALLIITVSVGSDILYYTDSLGTSFPPFAGSAIFSLLSFPFLLAAGVFYLIMETVYGRRTMEAEPVMPKKIYRRRMLTKRASMFVILFIVSIILTGSFVSLQMGVRSFSYVCMRMEYLLQAYGPLLLLSLFLFFTSWNGIKKDSL